MRELLEKLGTNELTDDQLTDLENHQLIMWYDGYKITELGWLLLLRDRAPVEEIKALLDMEEPEYLTLLAELKERSL